VSRSIEAQKVLKTVLERFGATGTKAEGKAPDELMKDLLDRVPDTEPQSSDEGPARAE
jgi:hypothetical protein